MRTIGQVAYDAYCEKSGGVSMVTGVVLPSWEHLPEYIQKGWEYAAAEVIDDDEEDRPRGSESAQL